MAQLNTPALNKILSLSYLFLFAGCIKQESNNMTFLSSSEGKIENILFTIRSTQEMEYDEVEIKSIDSCFSEKATFIFDKRIISEKRVREYLQNQTLPYWNILSNADLTDTLEIKKFIETLYSKENSDLFYSIASSSLDKILPNKNYFILNSYPDSGTTPCNILTYFYNIVDVYDVGLQDHECKYVKLEIANCFLDSILQSWHYTAYSDENPPFRIEGGNYFIGNDYILIGESFKTYNSEIPGAKLEKEVLKYFNVKHVFYSTSDICHPTHSKANMFQPYYHLDMYLTPLGYIQEKEWFLVGEIFPSFTFNDINGINYFINNKEAANVLNSALNQSVDSLVKNFEETLHRKIGIIRIPIMYYGERMFSFNNCIVENTGDTVTLFLPQYYKSDCDSKNITDSIGIFSDSVINKIEEEIYKSNIGIPFKIVKVKGNFIYKDDAASLHCMSRVIERSPIKQSEK